ERAEPRSGDGRRREPEDGNDRRGRERQGTFGEEGDADPRPGPPQTRPAVLPRLRHAEQPEEGGEEHRRVEQERAREADEPGREREDGAGGDADLRPGEDRAEPREHEAGEHPGDRADEPRAPGGDAERIEGERGEPEDQGRLQEERLSGEVERAPVPPAEDRLGERRIEDGIADEVAGGDPAGEQRGREGREREDGAGSKASAMRRTHHRLSSSGRAGGTPG